MSRKCLLYVEGEEKMADHRPDFDACPHCYHKMENAKWIRKGHTLCLKPRFYRSGCASMLSECPKCFESSWVHIELDGLQHYRTLPKCWKTAAMKESAAQKLAALRHWGATLCWRCKHLKSASIEHHAYRHCEHGMGPPESECLDFAENSI